MFHPAIKKTGLFGGLAACLFASALSVPPAAAQDSGGFSLPSLPALLPAQPQPPKPAPAAPSGTSTLPDLKPDLHLPAITPYASPSAPENNPLIQTRELDLRAKLTDEGGDIPTGLVWRVFSPDVGPDGQLPLIASAQGGSAVFNLPAGSYLVHVAYGRAGATKRITLGNATRHEVMMLDAGGLKLNAVLPDNGRIKEDLLRFSIYAGEDSNERSLIVPDVKPNTIVRLNSGPYHIVSNYGTANAIIRADIRVEAGKLTEATVQHRAAEMTLKLVREPGGEALADTTWSVLNASGDVVRESTGAYSSMVLIEGDYVAVAKNRDHIYQRDFKVKSGRNEEVEVVANSQSEPPQDSMD